MAIPKRKEQHKAGRQASSSVRQSSEKALEQLYARVSKTKLGSRESKLIAKQIVAAIG